MDTALAFGLQAPAAARETIAGWTAWRRTRHSFTPAPRLHMQQYQRLTGPQQRQYDFHRAATHANLFIQETPMSAHVSTIMWSRIMNNGLKQRPSTRAGLMVSGAGYQGKTETVCEIAAAFEDQWLELHGQMLPHTVEGTRDLTATVAYVQTPVTATPKSVCQAILDFYGAPYKGMTLAQLVTATRASLYDHGTQVLILDDITRLRMHREADQDALDLLRSLMSMHVTLVLVGVGITQSGLLGYDSTRNYTAGSPSYAAEIATQTQRRFDLVELGPFSYATAADINAWVQHLAGIEKQLRLLQAPPGVLTSGAMPEYLFRRTAGIVGLLERLIEDGCAAAIASSQETLTAALLDHIPITIAGAGRLPSEIPSVPEYGPSTATARKSRKARNTVFDENHSSGRAA